LFKNYRFAKVLEKICLRESDRVIVVVSENKTRIISLGVNPQKVFVVSNTVNLNIFKNNDSDVKNIIFDNEKRPIILYSGIVGPDRGLLTAVKSAFHFEKSNICPLIIIIGEGSYKRYLIEFVEKNDLRGKVKFLNWPGHDKIPAFINKAAICMIPQPRNDFINTTVPHKLFEFMAIGKPLLVSDALPLKRIVEETNSGLVFKSDDSKDFSDKVFELLSSDIPFGTNGLKAVKEKYNWQHDSQVLIDMYRDLNNKLN
jgi:glycosyltransferase involved in cell wall biosynthesis